MKLLAYRRRNTTLALAAYSRATATGNEETSPAIDSVDGGCTCSTQPREPRFRVAPSHPHDNNERFRLLEEY